VHAKVKQRRVSLKLACTVLIAAGGTVVAATSLGLGQPSPAVPTVAGVRVPVPHQPAQAADPNHRAATSIAWRLNNPAPTHVPESRANPVPVADKFAARASSIEQRAALRAYEGAPPVIPHATADLNIQTCRACHAQGLKAGDKVAKMVSHTYMANCTQCHVEAAGTFLGTDPGPANSFVGLRSSGYGGTRAWAGAPPVMPHAVFMRTNCVSCHGEHGYNGWRPDHLSRTNCVQCHAPAAEFEQLSPAFGIPDVADGQHAAPKP
jgi:cytochrome c-type protein NapB